MCGVVLCAIFVNSCVFLEYCGINNDIQCKLLNFFAIIKHSTGTSA